MEPGTRLRRALWSAVIFLAVIGVAVALRRIVHLWPILNHGYIPVATTSNPRAAQFVALDDIFARHPILTSVHIVPGLLFMLLGPLQFSSTIRARHLRWHRWSGRIFMGCGLIIGSSALVMSFTMKSIGGVNQAAATIFFSALFCTHSLHTSQVRACSNSQPDPLGLGVGGSARRKTVSGRERDAGAVRACCSSHVRFSGSAAWPAFRA